MRRTAAVLALAVAATAFGAGTAVAAPQPAPPQPCPAVPPDRVNAAVAGLAQPFPNVPWRVTGSGASVDCTLNWVRVDPQGATASSPTHILLFQYYRYAGTATPKPTAFTTVAGSKAPGQITISYRWLDPGDVNANPTGHADVRFEVTPGGKPRAIDPIPPQVQQH